MDIEAQIRSYIAKNLIFSDEYPHPDGASFLDNGIIDSLGVMELVLFVEDRFKISVNEEDITPDHFDSVSKLSDYIRSKATR
jgi:acyl carrier protein